MGSDENSSWVWNQVAPLEVELPDGRCLYARDFGAWVDQLVTGIRELNVVLVNQAKILLQDKFFDWYRFVPNAHRLRLGLRGHVCIFQVYELGYGRLKNLELSLTPPLVFVPDPRAIPPPPIIGGIFLGEDLDRQDEGEQGEDQKADGI